ncbi:MAG: hypothetical protein U9Q85_01365 [Patescibacteria group bacterium]|nr:hypothetical protein [Patescibacteria group bacterium]
MINNLSNISKKEASILKTLVFFDMFDFPLTAFELWQYSCIECDLGELIAVLDNSEYLKRKISVKNIFYCLRDREEIISIRLARYHSSARKFKKAKSFIYLFRLFPWIEMIAMANVIGADNLRDESDIDLFIITSSKRIWITRFFCILITKLFNARPKPGKKRDKICLSFYVARDGLNLKNLMLADDVYFKHWLISLMPLLDRKNTYKKFIKKNFWIKKDFPNWEEVKTVENRKIKNIKNIIYLEIFDLFFGGLDQTVKKLQLKLLAPELKKKLNKDTSVVMSDQVLKMYSNDRRESYKKRYNNKLKVYKVESL